MSDSTLQQVPYAPIGYTALAIIISLVCRTFLMPHWSPIEKPPAELSFLVLWVMSVLPVLYLSFRRWVEHSINSFMPQVFLFLVFSFGIQTALNASSIGFGLLNISSEILMLLVWALPWLALATIFKTSYSTAKKCRTLLLALTPTVLVFHVLYLMLPAFTLAYSGIGASAAILFGLVFLLYSVFVWRLRKTTTRV